MSYIKWDVKEVKVEGETKGAGEVTAILKGSAPWGIHTDVVRLHRNLYNQLNPVSGDDCIGTNRPLTENEKYHILQDIWATRKMLDEMKSVSKPDIKKVVFNSPATIVFWKDGSKTVVKAQNDETFDPEKGLAMAIAKKTMGNKGNYYNEIKKWAGEYYKSKTFGDALVEAAETEKKDTDHAKYASLRAAFYSLGQVSTDKRAKKSDMVEAIEEAIEYIKKFLAEEDR